ncbi:MAG: hypothetical protein R3B06_27960 [Kofleriaceae bacterium]
MTNTSRKSTQSHVRVLRIEAVVRVRDGGGSARRVPAAAGVTDHGGVGGGEAA